MMKMTLNPHTPPSVFVSALVILAGCGELAPTKKNLRTDTIETIADSNKPTIGKLQHRLDARKKLSPDAKKSFGSAQANHGFGFNLTAIEIPSELDVSKLSPEKQAKATSTDLKTQPAPSTLYTGDSLRLDKCIAAGFGGTAVEAARAQQAFPSSAVHLGEILTQPFIFDVFAPEDRWFETAMMSLEEWDPTGVTRAKDPIHPFLRKRLGKAVDPGAEYWKLTAVSFRVGDRSAIAESANTLPIVGQIKIGYGLDTTAADSDESIISASLIHSIAISPKFYDDFIYDLLTIRQDKTVSGCDVFRIVDKWVRNNGATLGDPLGFYFFLHTNIFDNLTTIPIREWRLTELKPILYDTLALARLPDDLANVVVAAPEDEPSATMSAMDYEGNEVVVDNRYGKVLPNTERRQQSADYYYNRCITGAWLKKIANSPEALQSKSDEEKQAAIDCPLLATEEAIDNCFAAASLARCNEDKLKNAYPITKISEAYENIPFTSDAQTEKPTYPKKGKSLRVTPIEQTLLQVVDDNSTQTIPRRDLAYKVWFSGTVSDCAQLPSTDSVVKGESTTTNPDAISDINCRLLIKADGSRARPDHPAFMFENAWSCAGCHMRRDNINLKADQSGLAPIPSMNKTHIAFGDGGNRPCNSFLHRPRPGNKVSISPYFLEFSNGFAMNGYSPTPKTTIPPADLGAFGTGGDSGDSGAESSVDAFRCFSRSLDPGLGF